MVRSIERGLSLRDFEEWTPGMIIDYIVTYNNLNADEEDQERDATQADFDSF